ncbi:MAG: energy transducer TonB [Oligoflexia bacterium]|nr:energy transducer TonB [Oligoflexia bacterium]
MVSKLVLENKLGQVVRQIQWKGQDFHLVYRHDTRRVVAISDLSQLDHESIPYTIISQVGSKDLSHTKGFKVGAFGSLRLVSSNDEMHLSPSIELTKEEEDLFPFVFKRTLVATVALLAIIFLLSFFVGEEEPEVVVVRITPTQPLPPPPVVAPVEKPIPQAQSQVKPKKVVQNKVARPTHAPIKTMGALAVLGSLNGKSKQVGGLASAQVQTSRGVGLGGGTQGSGGVQTAYYGKGLMAAPLGPGARASGAGGYGTRGKGGGQAGYGQMSLVGSSSGFFEPVGREMVIEGGLTREQVDAVIRRNLGQVTYCYERVLQTNPNLGGRVALKFFVNGGGQVSSANITSSSLGSPEIEKCLVTRLKGWQFPKPRGGVTVKVSYPFVFNKVTQG